MRFQSDGKTIKNVVLLWHYNILFDEAAKQNIFIYNSYYNAKIALYMYYVLCYLNNKRAMCVAMNLLNFYSFVCKYIIQSNLKQLYNNKRASKD